MWLTEKMTKESTLEDDILLRTDIPPLVEAFNFL